MRAAHAKAEHAKRRRFGMSWVVMGSLSLRMLSGAGSGPTTPGVRQTLGMANVRRRAAAHRPQDSRGRRTPSVPASTSPNPSGDPA